jgi:hypothetical protein
MINIIDSISCDGRQFKDVDKPIYIVKTDKELALSRSDSNAIAEISVVKGSTLVLKSLVGQTEESLVVNGRNLPSKTEFREENAKQIDVEFNDGETSLGAAIVINVRKNFFFLLGLLGFMLVLGISVWVLVPHNFGSWPSKTSSQDSIPLSPTSITVIQKRIIGLGNIFTDASSKRGDESRTDKYAQEIFSSFEDIDQDSIEIIEHCDSPIPPDKKSVRDYVNKHLKIGGVKQLGLKITDVQNLKVVRDASNFYKGETEVNQTFKNGSYTDETNKTIYFKFKYDKNGEIDINSLIFTGIKANSCKKIIPSLNV